MMFFLFLVLKTPSLFIESLLFQDQSQMSEDELDEYGLSSSCRESSCFPGCCSQFFGFLQLLWVATNVFLTRSNLCRPRCPQLIQKGRQSNSWRVYQARRPCWYLAMRSRFLSNVGGVFISCRGWVHQIGIEVVQILGKVVGSENSGAPRHDGPVQQIKFRETCLVLPAGWVCELVAPLEFGPH